MRQTEFDYTAVGEEAIDRLADGEQVSEVEERAARLTAQGILGYYIGIARNPRRAEALTHLQNIFSDPVAFAEAQNKGMDTALWNRVRNLLMD